MSICKECFVKPKKKLHEFIRDIFEEERKADRNINWEFDIGVDIDMNIDETSINRIKIKRGNSFI